MFPPELAGGLETADAATLHRRLLASEGNDALAMVAEAWLMGVRFACNSIVGRRTCRICGCWEHAACEGGCGWVADDLCSACETPDV
jgi:hypothetical protein